MTLIGIVLHTELRYFETTIMELDFFPTDKQLPPRAIVGLINK